MATTEMNCLAGGGGAQYASGSDSLPSSGTKTITCGFQPQIIILKFLEESSKYRETIVYDTAFTDLTPIKLAYRIYNPNGTINEEGLNTEQRIHVNDFEATSNGFVIGTSKNASYSTSFDWEVYGL